MTIDEIKKTVNVRNESKFHIEYCNFDTNLHQYLALIKFAIKLDMPKEKYNEVDFTKTTLCFDKARNYVHILLYTKEGICFWNMNDEYYQSNIFTSFMKKHGIKFEPTREP